MERPYTEDEIAAAVEAHFPIARVEYEDDGPDVFCGGCSHMRQQRPYGWHGEPWTTEHLLKALREARSG
jgi:hypothetical protein